MGEASVQTLTERVTMIRVRADGEWATVYLRPRKVVVDSSYHTWSFYFVLARDEPLTVSAAASFLLRCSNSYLAGKALGADCRELDVEASVESARHSLLESRRYGDLDAAQARAEWDELDDVVDDPSWTAYLHQTEVPDQWESTCTREAPAWTSFWERLWLPHIRPALYRLTKKGGLNQGPHSFCCVYDLSGLITTLFSEPDAYRMLRDGDGNEYPDRRAALSALLKDSGARDYFPLGCHSPLPDGDCPKHKVVEMGPGETCAFPVCGVPAEGGACRKCGDFVKRIEAAEEASDG